jgi:hypothetical protein
VLMGAYWKAWKNWLVTDYITNADPEDLKTLCDDFNITLEQCEEFVR